MQLRSAEITSKPHIANMGNLQSTGSHAVLALDLEDALPGSQVPGATGSKWLKLGS